MKQVFYANVLQSLLICIAFALDQSYVARKQSLAKKRAKRLGMISRGANKKGGKNGCCLPLSDEFAVLTFSRFFLHFSYNSLSSKSSAFKFSNVRCSVFTFLVNKSLKCSLRDFDTL